MKVKRSDRSVVKGFRRAAAALMLVLAAAQLGANAAPAATGNVAVSVAVPSTIALTNSCTSPAAYQLGTVLPGGTATTTTGASVCRLSWLSGNDSAMLRIGQADGTGGAMSSQSSTVTTQSIDDPSTISAVASFDSTRSFAVRYGGSVMRTTNGGAAWTTFAGVVSSGWGTAVATDPNDATANTWWVAGDSNGGDLLKTTNGLAGSPTWTSQKVALQAGGWPAGQYIQAVTTFKDGGGTTNLFVAGSGGWMAKSTDGGVTFVAYQIAGTGGPITGVSGIPGTSTIFAVSCNKFLKTTTGGPNAAAWSSTNTFNCATSVSAADATHVYASDNGGIDFYNGTTWTLQHPTTDYMWNVATVSSTPGTAFAVGERGDILVTTNSGTTWTRQDSHTGNSLLGIAAASTSNLIAVGNARTSVTTATGGATWTVSNQLTTAEDNLSVAASPTNGQLVLQAGSNGWIRRSSDGGGTWAVIATPNTEALHDVAWADATVAVAVGDNGSIIRSGDAGLTWTSTNSTPGVRLRGVIAPSPQAIFAVGEGGVVLKSIDAGTTWRTLTSGTTVQLNAVYSADGGTVVAVGETGTVIRSTDGGSTWSPSATTPNTRNLQDLGSSDGTTLWAPSGWQEAWRSTDGGVNWSAVKVTGSPDLTSVAVAAPGIVYFGTAASKITYSLDGGLAWTTISTSGWMDNVMRGIAVTDANTVYVATPQSGTARMLPSATATVSNYGAGANWGSAASTNMFGVCLQNVNVATTTVNGPTWQRDTAGTSGQCEMNDADPWYAIPAAMSKVAYATTPGQTGRADFVFGVRMASSQAPGTYSATIVFEALAPNV